MMRKEQMVPRLTLSHHLHWEQLWYYKDIRWPTSFWSPWWLSSNKVSVSDTAEYICRFCWEINRQFSSTFNLHMTPYCSLHKSKEYSQYMHKDREYISFLWSLSCIMIKTSHRRISRRLICLSLDVSRSIQGMISKGSNTSLHCQGGGGYYK